MPTGITCDDCGNMIEYSSLNTEEDDGKKIVVGYTCGGCGWTGSCLP